MDDLISRKQAIDALETIGYDFSESDLSESELAEVCEAAGDVRQDMINRLKRLPSIQPKIGKWVEINKFSDCRYVKCDQCEAIQVFYYGKRNTNFCPNCGAKMGDEDE